MKNQGIKLLSGLFLLALSFAGCKKDRVTQDSYQPLDDFYKSNRQQEQVFDVDSPGTGPCIKKGNDGTVLYNFCDDGMFIRPADSAHLWYNYKVGLVELYTSKDMIMWPASNVAGGQVLESSPSIRVRVFKDNDEYILRQGSFFEATLNDSLLNSRAMSVYNGNPSGDAVNDWQMDALSRDTVSPPRDSIFVYNTGWLNCSKLHTASSTGVVTVSVAGNNPQNIGIYIIFKNFRSVVKISNLVSTGIPVNEPFTFVAFAMNQNNQYLLDKRDMTITGNTAITLSWSNVSQTDLLTTLGGL